MNWPRNRFLCTVFVSLLFASASRLPAEDLPPLVLPHGVGVNIHFTTGHAQDLDLIAAADKKLVINAAKYPVDKSRGNALKYDKL